MKPLAARLTETFCRNRFLPAVIIGLGAGWAMSRSLGAGVGFAIGGAITVLMLAGKKSA